MKLITYRQGGQTNIGAVVDDMVIPLGGASASGAALPNDMIEFLKLGDAGLASATQVIKAGANAVALSSVDLMSPIPRPPKIMMGGRNYLAHVTELRAKTQVYKDVPVPKFPRIFAKYATAVNAHGKPARQPAISNDVDFEGELSLVICKDGRNIPKDQAYDYIGGYTIVNDVTARDIQEMDELTLSKSFEGFCPIGPWIVTKDEIPDPHKLLVRTYVNDRLLMENSTSTMLHDIPTFVSFLSHQFLLEAGDIITTGSPPGPGKFLEPPLTPKPGDTMHVEVEGIGRLSTPLIA